MIIILSFRAWDSRNVLLASTEFGTGHIDWRWGVLTQVLGKLVPMEVPLRGTWSETKYKKGHDGNDDHGQQEDLLSESDRQQLNELDFGSLTTAIISNLFWMYARMLLGIHRVCDTFSAWAETCACHDGFVQTERENVVGFSRWWILVPRMSKDALAA